MASPGDDAAHAMPESIRVFVPVGRAPDAAARAVSGTVGSAPAVVGLLDNHKHNTARVLDRLEQRLRERHPGIRVLRVQKPEAGKGAPRAILDALARDCQAVINGIGD